MSLGVVVPPLHHAIGALLLLTGCTEPVSTKVKHEAPDSSHDTADSHEDSTPASGEERCNGLDDDDDGEIDEGFDDADADGIADCLECEVKARPAATVTVNGECSAAGPVEDPWDMVLKWSHDLEGMHPFAPFFALDVDGDGSVEIVGTVAFYEAELLVIDGSNGDLKARFPEVQNLSGVALADVSGNQKAEIVTLLPFGVAESLPAAFNSPGGLVWRADSEAYKWFWVPLVMDMDGDGTGEIYVGTNLVDGQEGLRIAKNREHFGPPAIMDIDGDGIAEVAVDGCLLDEGLGERWCIELPGDCSPEAVMADVDGDGTGEVLFLCQDLDVVTADGARITHEPLPCEVNGSPSVADFDGDGRSEIAYSVMCATDRTKWLILSEFDGTNYATREVFDSTDGYINPIGWDVDADGAYEVLVYDGDTFYILDGSTLEVLAEYTDFSSLTCKDYPIVADIDGDGSAEIVLVSDSYTDPSAPSAILALGHAHNAWPAAGPAWPVWDYDGVNVRSDGTLAPGPRRPWDHGNRVRARPAASSPDLRPEIAGLCVGACTREGRARIAWRVANEGAGPATGGFEVRVYARAMTGLERKLLGSFEVSERVVEGRTVEGVYEFGLEGLDPGRGLLIGLSVDDDGAGGRFRECDEADNEVWAPLACEQE